LVEVVFSFTSFFLKDICMYMTIAAFALTGKTTFAKANAKYIDLDESKIPTENFGPEYVKQLRQNLIQQNVVFVSTHPDMLLALRQAGMHYALAYPMPDAKDEYVKRAQASGKAGYADLVSQHFDAWVANCQNQPGAILVPMRPSMYLTDVFEFQGGGFFLSHKYIETMNRYNKKVNPVKPRPYP
jgi:hypothetical protein